MIIISWNINGIPSRFAELQALVKDYTPDFVCLQKVRLNSSRDKFQLPGYRQLSSIHDCGNWSGVMIYSKTAKCSLDLPLRIPTPELSEDGHLQVCDCNDFTLINAYVPFANFSIEGAVGCRKRWDDQFLHLAKALADKKPVVVCGDLNVVHAAKDSCERNIELNRPCFTSWERHNFNRLLTEADLADTFRVMYPERQAATYYGNYRHLNKGNRIDYILISNSLIPRIKKADILNNFGSGQSVPVILEF